MDVTRPEAGGRDGLVARYVTSGFAVCDFDLPAGYRMDPHAHSRSGVVLPLRGRYRAVLDGRGLDVSGDRIGILPAGARHRETAGEEGSRCLLVTADGAPRDGRRVLDLDEPRGVRRPDLVRLGRWLYAELRRADAAAELVVESLLLDLFAPLPAGSREVPRGAPDWMGRVQQMIHDAFAEPLGHAEIAREAGVSREHLARTFRRLHGLPLGAYVRRIRVQEAARQLRTSRRRVSAIAARCGFSDQSHLTRTFRRHFDLTPTEYRSRADVAGSGAA